MDNLEKIKSLKSELLELEAKDVNQLFKNAKSNIIGGIGIFLIGCFILAGSLNVSSEASIPAVMGAGLMLWGIIGLIVGASKNGDAENTKVEVQNRILSIKKELLDLE